MLSKDQKLARDMRRTRGRKGLSQAEAVRQARVSPSWLCQVETGTRRPSRRLAESLERVYGLRPGRFVNKYAFPGRGGRPVDQETAKAIQAVLSAISIDSPAPERSPRRQVWRDTWRDWRGNVANPLWPVACHLGKDAQEEIELLESRQTGDTFWKLLNGIPFDSWTERRFMVKLGLAGGQMVRLAPARVGVQCRLVDHHGVEVGHRPLPAMVVHYQGVTAVIWPQRAVQAETLWKLDALAVVSAGGNRLTVNIEIDDPDRHNRARDSYRDDDVSLTVLRYHPGVINARGFILRLFSDLKKLVQP